MIKATDYLYMMIVTDVISRAAMLSLRSKNLEQAVYVVSESRVAHSYSNEGLISYDDFFRGNMKRFTNAKITYTWPDRGERKSFMIRINNN